MASRKDVVGKCYTYRGLKFYAQNGFVCLHDEATGEFFVLTRREFLERASALSAESVTAVGRPPPWDWKREAAMP